MKKFSSFLVSALFFISAGNAFVSADKISDLREFISSLVKKKSYFTRDDEIVDSVDSIICLGSGEKQISCCQINRVHKFYSYLFERLRTGNCRVASLCIAKKLSELGIENEEIVLVQSTGDTHTCNIYKYHRNGEWFVLDFVHEVFGDLPLRNALASFHEAGVAAVGVYDKLDRSGKDLWSALKNFDPKFKGHFKFYFSPISAYFYAIDRQTGPLLESLVDIYGASKLKSDSKGLSFSDVSSFF
ncbi:MAG: hypothetical protein LBK29_02190 [Oscillospiraceae bacterium]|jgi:hypothetical protein|nr:hypothetical protein [Oscillospiraceae bacterium]